MREVDYMQHAGRKEADEAPFFTPCLSTPEAPSSRGVCRIEGPSYNLQLVNRF